MSKLTNALVFCTALLASAAQAATKSEIITLAQDLNGTDLVTRLEKKRTKVLTIGDRNAIQEFLISCPALLNGVEVSASTLVRALAVLSTVQKAVLAELAANYSKDLARLSIKIQTLIDTLTARIAKHRTIDAQAAEKKSAPSMFHKPARTVYNKTRKSLNNLVRSEKILYSFEKGTFQNSVVDALAKEAVFNRIAVAAK